MPRWAMLEAPWSRARWALLALASPWLLAVGFGLHSRLGGLQEGLLLQGLILFSEPVLQVTSLGKWVGLAGIVSATTGGILLGAMATRRGGTLSAAVAMVEGLLALLGLIALTGVFAVGVGLDRWVFWGGAALLFLGARSPAHPLPWSDPRQRRLRAGLLVVSVGAALLAGETLLEGPGQHSPPFRLRELWLGGPGRSPWTSGGIWLGAGALAAVASRSKEGAARWTHALPVGLLAITGSALRPNTDALRLAEALSAAGVLLLAWVGGRWIRRHPVVAGTLDPRTLLTALLPLVFWSGVCAARGLTVCMWTYPGDLPEGVEQIAPHADVFSLGLQPDTGAVVFTNRERRQLGILGAGGERTFDLPAGPEEVLVHDDGTIWVSLIGERGSGLVAIDPNKGPRLPIHVIPGGCWLAGLFLLPDRAASAADLPRGTTAVGCEDGPDLWLATRPLAFDGRRVLRNPVEEAAFHTDGTSLYTVALWSGWELERHAWPDGGEPLAQRTIGGFNWTVTFDEARDRVWVGRFFEGALLALDAETLEIEERVPLSFGIRAMVYEPVHDRLWVSAAYSGRIWSISASDPSDRQVFGLCGQGRALVAAPDGSVVVATDCGLFRIAGDP